MIPTDLHTGETHGASVRYEVGTGVATLTLDEPATRNALTPGILDGLAAGLDRAATDPAVRVVVLTHTGPAFCAGADLRVANTGVRSRDDDRDAGGAPAGAVPGAVAGVGALPSILTAITRSPLPVVARLHGHAMGGGVGLAAACDVSIAADGVRFGFTEVRLGVAPAVISVVCLAKLRRADALELFLTGARIDARRAADVGLITRAVAADELDDTVEQFVRLLLEGGPRALAASKRLVYEVPGRSEEEAYPQLAELSAALFASDEGVEGRAAFRDKRPASWVPDEQRSAPAGPSADPLP